jgi:hypothetical protein
VGLKVAVIGLAPSTRDSIPWGDPEWELWGLAWDSERYHFHRAFEMHDMEEITTCKVHTYQNLPEYFEKVSFCRRVYMAEAYPEVPGAERYPFERVAEVCGAYWESSIAYMVALAITEGAEEIAIHGVSMKASEEYAYQRPNLEYLIGLATGKGIKVTVPEGSPVMKFSGFDGYAGRYGKKR